MTKVFVEQPRLHRVCYIFHLTADVAHALATSAGSTPGLLCGGLWWRGGGWRLSQVGTQDTGYSSFLAALDTALGYSSALARSSSYALPPAWTPWIPELAGPGGRGPTPAPSPSGHYCHFIHPL